MIRHVITKWKVFIEGIDVSAKVSSVGGIRYELNGISGCTVTMECDKFDFIVTEDDLKKIKEFRDSASLDFTFNNEYKDSLLKKIVGLKSKIRKNKDTGKEEYLYEFGLYSHIIPVNANIRVFIYVDGIWYFAFTGLIIARSLAISEMGRFAVTYRCMDSLYSLKQSTILTSYGIFDGSVNQFNSLIKDMSTGSETPPSEISNNTLLIPKPKASFTKFDTGKRKFLDSLLYAIYGGVDKDLKSYGTAENTDSVITTEVTHKRGGNWSITRNKECGGMFKLKTIQVGIWGVEASDFASELSNYYSGWDIKVLDSVNSWDDIVGNEVLASDLVDLAANDVGPGFSYQSMEDIVNIIGEGTASNGIYNVTAGALKILMPGGLRDVYNALKPEEIVMPELEFLIHATRLQIFSYVLASRTNFIYYSSPKGHIVAEFPLYDVGDLGEENGFGKDNWRIFTRDYWAGSFSDNEDFQNLYSYAQAAPEIGPNEIKSDASEVKLFYDMQGIINKAILEKIGLRVLNNSVEFGYIPRDIASAKAKAELILSIANRKSYAGSMNLTFVPRIMLNRQIVLDEIGRAGLVSGQSFDLTVASTINTVVNLGYIRQKGTDGKLSVAFGNKVTDLSIDYSKFF